MENGKPSKGESLWIKVGLAIFSFLLGLLANYISKTSSENKSSLAYNTSIERIISVKQNGITSKAGSLLNKSQFRVHVENIGDVPIKDFAFRLIFNEGAQIDTSYLNTVPIKEVPYKIDTLGVAKNELRAANITLDVGQSITSNAIIESRNEPTVQVIPATVSNGHVNWVKTSSSSENLSLSNSIIILFKRIIYALVIPGLLIAIPTAIALFFFGISQKNEQTWTRKYMLVNSIVTAVSTVLKVYLYLSIIPAASDVAKHF
jgi:hypothetical protein